VTYRAVSSSQLYQGFSVKWAMWALDGMNCRLHDEQRTGLLDRLANTNVSTPMLARIEDCARRELISPQTITRALKHAVLTRLWIPAEKTIPDLSQAWSGRRSRNAEQHAWCRIARP
jgi:hypothetical protein